MKRKSLNLLSLDGKLGVNFEPEACVSSEKVGNQVTGIKRKKRVLRRCGKCENCLNPQRKKGCLRNKVSPHRSPIE